MTKKGYVPRWDDERRHGRRISVDGLPVTEREAKGMAAASLGVFAAYGYANDPEAAPDGVKAVAREAAVQWLRDFRRALKFFGGAR